MRKILLSIILAIALCSCSRSQPEFLSYSHPYDLQRLDFNLDVPKFYSKAEEEDISVQVIEETIQGEMWGDPDIILGKRYAQVGWHRDEAVAKYANLKFPRMSMFADTTGRLVAVCAVALDVNGVEIDRLRKYLKAKFGKEVLSVGNFLGNYDIFTWDADTYIIRLSVKEKEEESILGIHITTDANGNFVEMKPQDMDKGKVTDAYFCIIRKDGGEELVRKLSSGDFIFGDSGETIEATDSEQ